MSITAIEKYQTQLFGANKRTKDNINKPLTVTEFDLDIGDGFYHPSKMRAYMQFEPHGKASNGNFAKDALIKLVNNFFPRLWNRAHLRSFGQLVETVESPALVSDVLIDLNIPKSEIEFYKGAGFITDDRLNYETGRIYEVSFPLEYLFGFLRYNRDIMFNLGLTISFERASSDDACFYRWDKKKADGTVDVAMPHEGKIVINDFKIIVPIVEYESNYTDEMKAKLYKNPVLKLNYFVWSVHEEHGFKAKNLRIDLTTSFNSLQFDMPDVCIIRFQTNRPNDQQRDSSVYDHCQLTGRSRIAEMSSHLKNNRWIL